MAVNILEKLKEEAERAQERYRKALLRRIRLNKPNKPTLTVVGGEIK